MSEPKLSSPRPDPTRPGKSAHRLTTLLWSAGENSGRQILSLVFFYVTVRFLQPADLGRFALAVAFNAVPQIFVDETIGESLVQKASVDNLDWDTGFTLNLIVAALLLLVSFLVCWPLSMLMQEPFLLYSMPLLSVATLVGALGNIQRSFLARAMKFRFLAQTALIFQTVGGTTSVCLAALGYGAWSLMIGLLMTATVSSVVFWRFSEWKPRLRINWETVRDRMSYAGYSAAIRSVCLLRDQSPLIMAGLLMNLTELGFFSLALRVVRSLGILFEDGTTRPLIMLLSREQHDLGRFGPLLIELTGTVAWLAVPGYVGLAIIGPRALPLVFGQDWMPAGAFVPGLCAVLYGWLIAHIMVVSLRARSAGQVAFKFMLFVVLIDIALLALLMPHDLKFAIIGWAFRSVLTLPVVIQIMRLYLGVNAVQLAWHWFPAIVGTLAMGVILEIGEKRGMFSAKLLGACEAIIVGGTIYLIVATAVSVAVSGRKEAFRLPVLFTMGTRR